MKINWLNKACFKISISPKKKEKVDILIGSFDDDDHLKKKADILLLTRIKKQIQPSRNPFLISGPGEYEIKGVFIRGIEIQTEEEKTATVYTIEAEELKVCSFCEIDSKELSAEQLEKIGPVDIMTISFGQNFSSKQIQKVIAQLEPKIIVPIETEKEKSKAKLKEFLKEMGVKEIERKKQLIFKKNELKEDGAEIMVLASE